MSNKMEETKTNEPGKTARDSVCGMTVDKDTALKSKIADRTYYFCSQSCLDVYAQPERELKAMKRRVLITLLGVIAAGAMAISSLTVVTNSALLKTAKFKFEKFKEQEKDT